jgi:hypothetical protein
VEAKFFHAGADKGRRADEVGVDEDVAVRRSDEVGGEVTATDVVEVVGDLERGEGSGPLGVDLGVRGGGEEKYNERKEATHSC